jgi:hypothetical protein
MPDVVRGRRKILTVVGGGVASMLLVIGLGAWRGGSQHALAQLGTPLVLAALGALTYYGTHWARGVIVFWLGLSAFGFGVHGATMLSRAPVASLFSLLLAAGLAYSAFDLYTSDDVEAVVNPGAFPAAYKPRRTTGPWK